MKPLIRPLSAAALLALATGLAPAAWAEHMTLAEAVAADHRTDSYVARDRYRNPEAALRFFGVEPHHTLVELWPSAGYWSEILGPFLAKHGQYVAAQYATEPADTRGYRRRNHGKLLLKLADKDLYGNVLITRADQPYEWELGDPAAADVVLTFRNVHNWISGGYVQKVFDAAHTALKPGGVFGVVEHRAKPGTSAEQMERSGYVTEAAVIEIAERAGFRLAEKSELNANPKDDADHPNGVWTLPPSLRTPPGEREKYAAIGESDRMTLKFVKLLQP